MTFCLNLSENIQFSQLSLSYKQTKSQLIMATITIFILKYHHCCSLSLLDLLRFHEYTTEICDQGNKLCSLQFSLGTALVTNSIICQLKLATSVFFFLIDYIRGLVQDANQAGYIWCRLHRIKSNWLYLWWYQCAVQEG